MRGEPCLKNKKQKTKICRGFKEIVLKTCFWGSNCTSRNETSIDVSVQEDHDVQAVVTGLQARRTVFPSFHHPYLWSFSSMFRGCCFMRPLAASKDVNTISVPCQGIDIMHQLGWTRMHIGSTVSFVPHLCSDLHSILGALCASWMWAELCASRMRSDLCASWKRSDLCASW